MLCPPTGAAARAGLGLPSERTGSTRPRTDSNAPSQPVAAARAAATEDPHDPVVLGTIGLLGSVAVLGAGLVDASSVPVGADADCRDFPLGAPCVVDVSVTWDEYGERHRATAVASLRIDGSEGGLRFERRVRVDAEAEAQWVGTAAAFAASSGLTGSRAVGIQMARGVGASRSEIDDLRRRTLAGLQLDLAAALADELAILTLAQVDPGP